MAAPPIQMSKKLFEQGSLFGSPPSLMDVVPLFVDAEEEKQPKKSKDQKKGGKNAPNNPESVKKAKNVTKK